MLMHGVVIDGGSGIWEITFAQGKKKNLVLPRELHAGDHVLVLIPRDKEELLTVVWREEKLLGCYKTHAQSNWRPVSN